MPAMTFGLYVSFKIVVKRAGVSRENSMSRARGGRRASVRPRAFGGPFVLSSRPGAGMLRGIPFP